MEQYPICSGMIYWPDESAVVSEDIVEDVSYTPQPLYRVPSVCPGCGAPREYNTVCKYCGRILHEEYVPL